MKGEVAEHLKAIPGGFLGASLQRPTHDGGEDRGQFVKALIGRETVRVAWGVGRIGTEPTPSSCIYRVGAWKG